MREINAAYALILQGGEAPSSAGSGPPGPYAPGPGRPLTRAEIERMIQAIGTAGPVENALDAFRTVGNGIWTVLGAMAVVVVSVRLVVAVHGRDWAAIQSEPHMAVYPLVAAACLLVWYRQRRHQKHK
jgi:hypothetical protein